MPLHRHGSELLFNVAADSYEGLLSAANVERQQRKVHDSCEDSIMTKSDDFTSRTLLRPVLANLTWAVRKTFRTAPVPAALLVLQQFFEGVGPAPGLVRPNT